MDRKKLLKRISFLVFSIFLVNLMAMQFHWYSSMWYFDIIMHFMGGFWVGLFAFWLFKLENVSRSSIAKVIIFVLSVGLLWEVFEIVVNELTAENPLDVVDIISDLIFDTAGGLVSVYYFSKRILMTKNAVI
ncbi:MAG: hypothetical protein AAB873_02130 [Patescibacteria group bacterium]